MRRKRREEFRIRKYSRRYDRLSGKFTFDIGYETRTDITDRTVAVAEAFGMGISESQRHVLYDNVELVIGPQDIVYLTCLLYTSPSPRDRQRSRMPSSA